MLSLAVLVSCSGNQGTPAASTAVDSSSGLANPEVGLRMADAVTVYLATNADHPPVALWVTPDRVMAAEIDLDAGELAGESEVSGGIAPFAHPIERPAAVVSADGEVTIAFIGSGGDGESVHLTRWDRRAATPPMQVSGPPRPETVLVHATNDPGGEPLLSWLEDSTLSVGSSQGGTMVEEENVDDLTCDCCNPAPISVGDSLLVAFRDLEHVDGGVVRDVVATSRTVSGWTETVPIADDHWFIDACPFSGPSAVETGERLVVAWMDARQSVHPNQAGTTIWVDRSDDAGVTFGNDLAVTDEGIHRWPVMAVDEAGTIHLVWETQGAEGGLSYATSDDGGRSFSDPVLLVERDADAGSPTSPSVIVHEGRLLVSWADGTDGHVALWTIGENQAR